MKHSKANMPELERSSDQLGSLITTGVWGDVPWEFIAGLQEPDQRLCDAAFCIVTYQGKIVLTEHKTRGYEFTGGHIEPGENIIAAVVREVREEGGAVIDTPRFFGYKKVSPSQPMPHRSIPDRYYPFPHSYVPYYFAEASGLLESVAMPEDIVSIRLVSHNEALKLLRSDQNHDKILDYLIANRLITVE
jgi:8-oxo-dGTP pyrophosphatase MutT (NUDIX family)